ncbi:hypothetical protein H8B02_42325 [Bradyrhizobium sp. Pear77]|uniref:hypothetical protein n=1 Tax=Bradyrhizobium altum TaxID=1571202 RepID=UPI001E4E49E0|nr:hypothetical protein [Bradyrhizobium altum]MCC8959811.1 hypothetical protein [Bradyrhizobium altum]
MNTDRRGSAIVASISIHMQPLAEGDSHPIAGCFGTLRGWGRLDDWRRNQADLPGRPEAIRRPVEIGLKV